MMKKFFLKKRGYNCELTVIFQKMKLAPDAMKIKWWHRTSIGTPYVPGGNKLPNGKPDKEKNRYEVLRWNWWNSQDYFHPIRHWPGKFQKWGMSGRVPNNDLVPYIGFLMANGLDPELIMDILSHENLYDNEGYAGKLHGQTPSEVRHAINSIIRRGNQMFVMLEGQTVEQAGMPIEWYDPNFQMDKYFPGAQFIEGKWKMP